MMEVQETKNLGGKYFKITTMSKTYKLIKNYIGYPIVVGQTVTKNYGRYYFNFCGANLVLSVAQVEGQPDLWEEIKPIDKIVLYPKKSERPKRYRLLKQYPNCNRRVGTIVYQLGDKYRIEDPYTSDVFAKFFDSREIELNPDFWREIKTVYISGKISGLDIKDVTEKFKKAEEILSKAGHDVVNPMNHQSENLNQTWEEYMIQDLKLLMNCDVIYMLPDWKDSEGAKIERLVALSMGMLFLEEEVIKNL